MLWPPYVPLAAARPLSIVMPQTGSLTLAILMHRVADVH